MFRFSVLSIIGAIVYAGVGVGIFTTGFYVPHDFLSVLIAPILVCVLFSVGGIVAALTALVAVRTVDGRYVWADNKIGRLFHGDNEDGVWNFCSFYHLISTLFVIALFALLVMYLVILTAMNWSDANNASTHESFEFVRSVGYIAGGVLVVATLSVATWILNVLRIKEKVCPIVYSDKTK